MTEPRRNTFFSSKMFDVKMIVKQVKMKVNLKWHRKENAVTIRGRNPATPAVTRPGADPRNQSIFFLLAYNCI